MARGNQNRLSKFIQHTKADINHELELLSNRNIAKNLLVDNEITWVIDEIQTATTDEIKMMQLRVMLIYLRVMCTYICFIYSYNVYLYLF